VQDVLADGSLIIGIRHEEFDVYWHGQSIFHANFKGRRVNVNTHVKYYSIRTWRIIST